ncbi:MAG TPA: AAA family ATPase [Phnomibacter sp.]|nr:AAA family ATPase [Phnomibacter sp.]
MNMLKKIVIIGPESTGKSTLCEMLAKHYNTVWCPEYAREYLLQHGTQYSYENLQTIAEGQIALEEMHAQKLLQQNESVTPIPPLIIDTDMQVMKVWCEFVFNDCHTWILNQIVKRKYDLYLLCKPDLPWVQDELREYPNEKPRQELYHIYREMMINQTCAWVDIHGSYDERFAMAVAAVDELLA